MTNIEERKVKRTAAKTRIPFRVAAFFLGVLFVAVGLYQLLDKAAAWIDFGLAIIIALTGLQFVYSAFTRQRKSSFVWPRRSTARQMPARFLVVEPVSFGIMETQNTSHSNQPEHTINPYAPPRNSTTTSVVQEPSTQGATLQGLTKLFLDGQAFIHYGVVFFIDSDDDQSIHAALPLSSSSDLLMQRNTSEAARVLSEFLSTLPNARPAVSGRDLVVRMISSYDHFDDDSCTRIVVPWATVNASCGEPTRI